MPNGYNGKILRVDLSDRKVWTEEPGEAAYRRYLGGGALALHYMLREMRPGGDPFGPENLLLFMTSVTNGFSLSGLNRYSAAGKSPLTGGFGESEAGGWWGPELKAAGFDGVIVQGRAERPVYLWVCDGQAEVRDAGRHRRRGSQADRPGQPTAGSLRPGQHLDRGDHRLCDGVLRERAVDEGGYGRDRPAVRERGGGDRADPQDRPARGGRGLAGRGRHAGGEEDRQGGGAVRHAREGAGAADARAEGEAEPGHRLRHVADRGGHMEGPHDPFYESLDPKGTSALAALGLLEPVDRMDLGPAKVRAHYYGQKVWSFYNAVGMCKFVGAPIGAMEVNRLVEYTQAVTGWSVSLWELLKVAERSEAMARIFNCREGFTPKDDILPDRMFEGLENGPLKGVAIDREELRQALKLYYEMQGWDAEMGFPTAAKLAELDLSWVK